MELQIVLVLILAVVAIGFMAAHARREELESFRMMGERHARLYVLTPSQRMWRRMIVDIDTSTPEMMRHALSDLGKRIEIARARHP